MKRLITGVTLAFLIALAGSLAMRAEEKKTGELVEVREISADLLTNIRTVAAELARMTEALNKAQIAASFASKQLHEARSKAMHQAYAFEGKCETNHNYWSGHRNFRRVTISGKFLLIHEGKEECPLNITLTGTTNWTEPGTVTLK